MSRSFSRVAALLTASVSVVMAAPQTQPPSFVAATRTVAVYATVTNAQGRLVPDLTRDDFTIDDNGKRQTLTLFSNDIQPITLVMLPGDRARVGTFGSQIQVEPAEFTSDREALKKILHGDLPKDGPTPLWNAVNTGIDKLLLEQGRRAILVFTDGGDEPRAGVNPGAFGGLGGRGLGGYSGRQLQQPDEGLPKLAEATGGGYFE